MSKCLILDLDDMDRIGKASDKVYKKLKNDGTISKYIDSTSRDIAILSIKYDKIII